MPTATDKARQQAAKIFLSLKEGADPRSLRGKKLKDKRLLYSFPLLGHHRMICNRTKQGWVLEGIYTHEAYNRVARQIWR